PRPRSVDRKSASDPTALGPRAPTSAEKAFSKPTAIVTSSHVRPHARTACNTWRRVVEPIQPDDLAVLDDRPFRRDLPSPVNGTGDALSRPDTWRPAKRRWISFPSVGG